MSEFKREFHPNDKGPMWCCWCTPDDGYRAHRYWEIACPDCGRLQPPHNSVLIADNKVHDLRTNGKKFVAPPARVNLGCTPNSETLKGR